MRLHRKGDAITSKRQTVYDEIAKPFKRNGPMIFQKCFIFCKKLVVATQNNHLFIQKHALSNKPVYIHFFPFHRYQNTDFSEFILHLITCKSLIRKT